MKWECIAVTHDDYNLFLESLRKSRDPNEKALVKRINEQIMPILEKRVEAQRQKVLKKQRELENLQKMASAKRSSRLAGKAEARKAEEEAAEVEKRRQAELDMARKEQQRQSKMEHVSDRRPTSRKKVTDRYRLANRACLPESNDSRSARSSASSMKKNFASSRKIRRAWRRATRSKAVCQSVTLRRRWKDDRKSWTPWPKRRVNGSSIAPFVASMARTTTTAHTRLHAKSVISGSIRSVTASTKRTQRRTTSTLSVQTARESPSCHRCTCISQARRELLRKHLAVVLLKPSKSAHPLHAPPPDTSTSLTAHRSRLLVKALAHLDITALLELLQSASLSRLGTVPPCRRLHAQHRTTAVPLHLPHRSPTMATSPTCMLKLTLALFQHIRSLCQLFSPTACRWALRRPPRAHDHHRRTDFQSTVLMAQRHPITTARRETAFHPLASASSKAQTPPSLLPPCHSNNNAPPPIRPQNNPAPRPRTLNPFTLPQQQTPHPTHTNTPPPQHPPQLRQTSFAQALICKAHPCLPSQPATHLSFPPNTIPLAPSAETVWPRPLWCHQLRH